jgi:hypothetical protein
VALAGFPPSPVPPGRNPSDAQGYQRQWAAVEPADSACFALDAFPVFQRALVIQSAEQVNIGWQRVNVTRNVIGRRPSERGAEAAPGRPSAECLSRLGGAGLSPSPRYARGLWLWVFVPRVFGQRQRCATLAVLGM